MTRFNIALFTLLLPSVLAAPSRHSTIVPCKRRNTAGPYDVGNSTSVYGATGTGTGISLSTGVPIAAPEDPESDDCPATTTITSTNIVTQTVILARDPAQTQASGSSAAGSAVLTFPAGPYGNATGSASRHVPGPTGTAGSTGRSSRHGHKHKHKTTRLTSTRTSVAEVPVSTGSSGLFSSSSTDIASSSSINNASSSSVISTSETSDVASAVEVTSKTASSTVDPGTSTDQSLISTTVSPTLAVSSSAIATSSTSGISTSTAGGEFYQAPKSNAVSSSASSTSPSSFPSSSSAPSSSAPSPSAPSSSAATSSVPSSTETMPSSTSATASSTGVTATIPATPNTSYSTSSNTGKRGLAYNAAALTSCFDSAHEVSWAYNWGSTTTGLDSAFEYVPMLWGTQAEHTKAWPAAASAALAAGSKHLLSFNEPDLGSQANLSPAAAAAAHKTFLQPFAGRARLAAPAVTNAGLAWLEQFLVACASCTVDFVPVHWYDSASNVAYFKAYVTSAVAAAKGRPVWITEFGASGSQAQQVAFLEEVMPWLDSLVAVERYAYFGVFDGNLVSGSGLSALGKTFATYT